MEFSTLISGALACGVAGVVYKTLDTFGWGRFTAALGGVTAGACVAFGPKKVSELNELSDQLVTEATETIKKERLTKALSIFSVLVASKAPINTSTTRPRERLETLSGIPARWDEALREMELNRVSGDSERGLHMLHTLSGVIIGELERLLVEGHVSADLAQVYLIMLIITLFRDDEFGRALLKVDSMILALENRVDNVRLAEIQRVMCASVARFHEVRPGFETEAFAKMHDAINRCGLYAAISGGPEEVDDVFTDGEEDDDEAYESVTWNVLGSNV
ncbi:ORF17 [Ictalurid herpesvirus 1]|nr:ORF17 [Ictalurid herpesvirus 1]